MKPIKKKIFALQKASGSTTSDEMLAAGATINESGIAINNNTKTMAAMITQTNSTNAIMFIAIAGIVAYLVIQTRKKS